MPDTTPTPGDSPGAAANAPTDDDAERAAGLPEGPVAGGAPEVVAGEPDVAADIAANVAADVAADLPVDGLADEAVAGDPSAAQAGADVDAAAEPAAVPRAAVAEMTPAACAARLAELFPALFARQGPPAPLKLRIQADIQQRAPGVFSRRTLSAYLHRLTTSTAYLMALTQAPNRLDLDGAPAGEPAEEHRQAAATELARRREIVQARRAAEQSARRAAHDDPRRGAAAGPREARPGRQGGRGPIASSDAAVSGDAGAGEAGSPETNSDRRASRPRDDGGRHRAAPPQARRQGGGVPQQANPVSPRPQAEASRPVQPSAEPRRQPVIEDPERQARANLLRAYETTTLTRANFIALKGLTEAALDAVLALAREESASRPQPARQERRPGPPQPPRRGAGDFKRAR